MLPLLDFLTGTHTRMYLTELEKSQWFSPATITRLQHLIRHAYYTVPYYHEIFRRNNLKPDDIKNSEDLVKLPVLSRSEVRERFGDLISKAHPREKMVYGLRGT